MCPHLSTNLNPFCSTLGAGSTFQLGLFVAPHVYGFTGGIYGHGTWVKPFGIPIFHVEDVMGDVGFAWNGSPGSTSAGSSLWIGHATPEGTLSSDNAIKISAYVGLGISDLRATFFYGSLSELSVKKVSAKHL